MYKSRKSKLSSCRNARWTSLCLAGRTIKTKEQSDGIAPGELIVTYMHG